MKAEDLIAQLEKINPCSTLDFLNENQEFINETTDEGLSVLEYLLKKGMSNLACGVIELESFDPNISGHNYLQTSLALGYTNVALHLLKKGARCWSNISEN